MLLKNLENYFYFFLFAEKTPRKEEMPFSKSFSSIYLFFEILLQRPPSLFEFKSLNNHSRTFL